MKSEQIKEITDSATEQLVAALNAGRSEARVDRLAFSTAHTWDVASRAGNAIAGGSGTTRPFPHDDHAPDIYPCQRKRPKTGRGPLGILIVPKCSHICGKRPTAKLVTH
jgi:hypothetical protein